MSQIDDMRTICQYLMLPGEERVRLSKKFLGKTVPPPWLDDRLMYLASVLGYTSTEPRRAPDGSAVRIVVLTDRGRKLAKPDDPVDCH